MFKRRRTGGFTEQVNRVNRLESVGCDGLNDPAHESLRGGRHIVESVEVLLHVEDIVATNRQDGVDVGSNHFLAVNVCLTDPSSTTSNIRGRNEVCIRLEPAGDAVHEVGLVKLGEDRRVVVGLEGVIGHLTGVGTGQKVALVGRVHDQATSLGSTAKRADVRVGKDVAKGGANFEQSAVLVFVAGVADPLIQAGLNAVELERHHFGTGTKGLAHGRRLHHAHHGVERGLSGGHEHVRNAFLTKRRTSVWQVHEKIERCGCLSVAVNSGPNPSVGARHEVARGVLAEPCWRIACPTEAVVERHVSMHQRRVVNSVEWVRIRNNTAVTKAPQNHFPFWEFFALGAEEEVIVVSGVAFQNGTTHALFVAG